MPHRTDEPALAEDTHSAVLRARLAQAVLNAPAEAIIAVDRDGVICFWNAGAARVFGFEAAEAIGQSLDIIIPERLQARHWQGFHHMVSTGESRYPPGHLLSAPGRRKDGSQLSVEFTVVALRDERGAVSNIVAVMRDITERFEELKALRKLARDKVGG